MNNEERDNMIRETHTTVVGMKATLEEQIHRINRIENRFWAAILAAIAALLAQIKGLFGA